MNFPITCYYCETSVSANHTLKARKWPQVHELYLLADPLIPFFPQLEEKECPFGSVVARDGTVVLCVYCHAFLLAQIRHGMNDIRGSAPTPLFICGVCGVKTERKRVRPLPIQKFRFLSQPGNRKPGSIGILMDAKECVVVCTACWDTLWHQSDEYDRWGLPEDKRHFNWIAKQPDVADKQKEPIKAVAAVPKTTGTPSPISSSSGIQEPLKILKVPAIIRRRPEEIATTEPYPYFQRYATDMRLKKRRHSPLPANLKATYANHNPSETSGQQKSFKLGMTCPCGPITYCHVPAHATSEKLEMQTQQWASAPYQMTYAPIGNPSISENSMDYHHSRYYPEYLTNLHAPRNSSYSYPGKVPFSWYYPSPTPPNIRWPSSGNSSSSLKLDGVTRL